MSIPLVPCQACGRHARPPRCPFCGLAIRVAEFGLTRRAFTRSVIMGSTLAASTLAACGGSSVPDDDPDFRRHGGGACEDVELEDEEGNTYVDSVCPPYGAPPADAWV